MAKQVDQKEMIDKVRAAIKDRATWFALLFRSFKEAFPEKDVERLARKAIFEFGRMKARNDPNDFSPAAWVEERIERFLAGVRLRRRDQRQGGRAAHEILRAGGGLEGHGLHTAGDRSVLRHRHGRRPRPAEAHGVRMELEERIARGDKYCNLKIFER